MPNDIYIVPLAVLLFSYVALFALVIYLSYYATTEIWARYTALRAKIYNIYLLSLAVFVFVSLSVYFTLFILPSYLFDWFVY
jgi:hypothetical protein|nr:MAG TPA: hypothetical protein [Caudoviricetes sp.]